MAAASVDWLAGPEILGYFFMWALQGILTVQVYLYHVTYTDDRLFLKLLVYVIFVAEWVQTGLFTADAFAAYVRDYGDVASITAYHNAWFAAPLMSSLVSAPVQCFFAWRLSVLGKSRILVAAIVTLACIQLGAGVGCAFVLRPISSSVNYRPVRPLSITWYVGNALVDTIIAISMTIVLTRAKSSMIHRDKLLNKMIRLTIESGILTASTAILGVVTSVAIPKTLLYGFFVEVMSKMYANTLLVNLNARSSFREELHVVEFGSTWVAGELRQQSALVVAPFPLKNEEGTCSTACQLPSTGTSMKIYRRASV